MEEMIHWLHLSDIHYGFTNYETEKVRDATLEYIAQQNICFDLIAITGDITYKCQAYSPETMDFLNTLRNKYLKDRDNLFLAPGNHDLERSDIRENLLMGILSRQDCMRYINDKMDEKIYHFLLSAFNGTPEKTGFFDFYREVTGHPYPEDSLHFIQERTGFNIIQINTCLFSGMDNEEGKLALYHKKLYNAMKEKEIKGSDKINIALGHHSLECLSGDEKQEFQNNLSDFTVDIYLCGHIHTPNATFDSNNINDLCIFGCGSGVVDNNSTVGMIIGRVERHSGMGEVKFHRWSEKNQKWDIDTEADRRARSGVLPFELKRFKRNALENRNKGNITMNHDVFISYAHEDKTVADKVCAALESERIRCWIAPRDIPPGKNYPGEIMNAVKYSKVFVLVYSPHSNISQHVLTETEKAMNCRIPIIPLRIIDVPLAPDMEYYIGRYQWLDALTAPLDKHMPKLTQAVQSLLNISKSDSIDRNTIHIPDGFVFIKGGIFLMGSPKGEVGRKDNEMQHQVKVSDFYMAKYPVTVAQFETFIRENNYNTDADMDGGSYIWNDKWDKNLGVNWRCDTKGELQNDRQHPVIHVSWNDASAYCKWLSEKLNKTFRLPTGAEWEYACRAGTTTPFNTGEFDHQSSKL
jgi:predicted MPP superfamily phosphohydrolase